MRMRLSMAVLAVGSILAASTHAQDSTEREVEKYRQMLKDAAGPAR